MRRCRACCRTGLYYGTIVESRVPDPAYHNNLMHHVSSALSSKQMTACHRMFHRYLAKTLSIFQGCVFNSMASSDHIGSMAHADHTGSVASTANSQTAVCGISPARLLYESPPVLIWFFFPIDLLADPRCHPTGRFFFVFVLA